MSDSSKRVIGPLMTLGYGVYKTISDGPSVFSIICIVISLPITLFPVYEFFRHKEMEKKDKSELEQLSEYLVSSETSNKFFKGGLFFDDVTEYYLFEINDSRYLIVIINGWRWDALKFAKDEIDKSNVYSYIRKYRSNEDMSSRNGEIEFEEILKKHIAGKGKNSTVSEGK